MHLKDDGTLAMDPTSYQVDTVKIDTPNTVGHLTSDVNFVFTPQQDTIMFNSGDNTMANSILTPQDNTVVFNSEGTAMTTVFAGKQEKFVLNSGYNAIVNSSFSAQNDTVVFSSDGTTMTNVCTSQQNSPFINNSEFDIVTSSAYTPFDFSSNPDSDNFATLADVVINDFEISSFEEFLRSDKENAFQLLKNYFQKDVTKEHVEYIQLFFFVFILVSIFCQLFGGNRDLPVE